MPNFTETLIALFTREPAFAVLMLGYCFLLIPVSIKLWWSHWILMPAIAFVAYTMIPDHSVGLELLIISCAVFPFLCRDFPNHIKVYKGGVIWFSVTAFMIAIFLSTPEPVKIREIINTGSGIIV